LKAEGGRGEQIHGYIKDQKKTGVGKKKRDIISAGGGGLEKGEILLCFKNWKEMGSRLEKNPNTGGKKATG